MITLSLLSRVANALESLESFAIMSFAVLAHFSNFSIADLQLCTFFQQSDVRHQCVYLNTR